VDVVEVRSSGPRRAAHLSSPRTGWWRPAIAGAVSFWSANLVISLTPNAAAYRSAMSIDYIPMLVEAAVGGLVVSSVMSAVMVRLRERVPGIGTMRLALLLSAIALILLTLLVEVPSKLHSPAADPGHWLVVASGFNLVRILALGVGIGLVFRADPRFRPRTPVTERDRR
jgi:hypothetical protein